MLSRSVSSVPWITPEIRRKIRRGNNTHAKLKPEARGPQRSPECTAMKAIFSQNTVNVAGKKN